MPKKGSRITSSLFKELLSLNCYLRGSVLNVLCKNNTDALKFSVVVSKKILKKAADRNKLKRQIREIVKEYLKNNKSNLYAIFMAKKGIEKLNYTDLKHKVEEDLKLLIK